VGADHRLTPDTAIGFALAGGGTSFGLDRGLGGGNSDLFQASVYARQNWGAAYLMGAFGYGWQDITTSPAPTSSRPISMPTPLRAVPKAAGASVRRSPLLRLMRRCRW
jgi:uncharacterized protein with beta-barrel porin domain